MSPGTPRSCAAVVVDYDSGPVLADCVASLRGEGIDELLVVENGSPEPAQATLEAAGLGDTPLLVTGRNLGYGGGVNRGLAALGPSEYVLVANPDLHVHRGALAPLVRALAEHPAWAVVGPRILTPEGKPYPSARMFPAPLVAAGHALLGSMFPDNAFTRRYRTPDLQDRASEVDWVSGACFLARRAALEQVGGFDERYFMFAEEMDLCWRARELGSTCAGAAGAVVTHVEGASRRLAPRAMTLAHHRSALRFEWRTARGVRRLLSPLASVVLLLRLALVSMRRGDV